MEGAKQRALKITVQSPPAPHLKNICQRLQPLALFSGSNISLSLLHCALVSPCVRRKLLARLAHKGWTKELLPEMIIEKAAW